MKTISDYPFLVGEVVRRNQARRQRRDLLCALLSFQRLHERLFPKRGTRTARISSNETVESNLPLRKHTP